MLVRILRDVDKAGGKMEEYSGSTKSRLDSEKNRGELQDTGNEENPPKDLKKEPRSTPI